MVGNLPVYMEVDQAADIDNVGYGLWTSSLMLIPEGYFDETNIGDYKAFDVRYLLLPTGKAPPVPANLTLKDGGYALWTIHPSGIVQVVDTQGTITANKSTIGPHVYRFMRSAMPGAALYPTIAFGGAPAATPTLGPGSTATGAAGRVVWTRSRLDIGLVTSRVVANRTSVVLLKSSFDPGWAVTVDGQPATTEMIAPAFVGVEVPAGAHTVTFVYRGSPYYPLLFLTSALSLVVVTLGRRRLSGLWQRVGQRFPRRHAQEDVA